MTARIFALCASGSISIQAISAARWRHLNDKNLSLSVRIRSDRRVRRACLTQAGLEERAELERLSDTVALRALEPLGDEQRRRLVAAMAEVERLLQASLVHFALEDPA